MLRLPYLTVPALHRYSIKYNVQISTSMSKNWYFITLREKVAILDGLKCTLFCDRVLFKVIIRM
jgi:hypothetical protein